MKRAAALATLTATAFAATAQARVVEPVWVNRHVDVAQGQTKSVTLKCPAHAVALNATPAASASTTSATIAIWPPLELSAPRAR